MINKLKKDSLSELVYQQISKMIMKHDFPPGEKINRKEIANMLGVSQTPVNEAIIRLTNEGVVEQKERHGFYVKIFTDDDMKELYAVRAGLEGVALRICLEKNDPEVINDLIHAFDGFTFPMDDEEKKKYRKADRFFHEKILFASGNSVISDFLKNFDFLIKCYQKGLIRQPEITLPEHQEIINAIIERKPEKAQILIMNHLLLTRDHLSKKHMKDI